MPARPRSLEQTQKPQKRPATAAPAVGAGAATLAGAGGAAAGGAVAATPALVPLAGLALTVETVERAFRLFFRRSRESQAAWLGRREIPGATQDDRLAALELENRLQAIFEGKVLDRVRLDIGSILAPDVPAQEQRLRLVKLMEREKRYAQQRAREMGRRLEKSAERFAVRRESARGAFWTLGRAKEHTPECVAMAGSLWSWEVLDQFHPPVGPGCVCGLVTEAQAVLSGRLPPGAKPRSVADAERIRALYGNHHGGGLPGILEVLELRGAIIGAGLAGPEDADRALARWLR